VQPSQNLPLRSRRRVKPCLLTKDAFSSRRKKRINLYLVYKYIFDFITLLCVCTCLHVDQCQCNQEALRLHSMPRLRPGIAAQPARQGQQVTSRENERPEECTDFGPTTWGRNPYIGRNNAGRNANTIMERARYEMSCMWWHSWWQVFLTTKLHRAVDLNTGCFFNARERHLKEWKALVAEADERFRTSASDQSRGIIVGDLGDCLACAWV
jgi:hypothetical protein